MSAIFRPWLPATLREPAAGALAALAGVFFPGRCIVCGGRPGISGPAGRVASPRSWGSDDIVASWLEGCLLTVACRKCIEDRPFTLIGPHSCRQCGAALPPSGQTERTCEACLRSPADVIAVRAAADYSGLVRDCIHHLKYQGRTGLARMLGRLLFSVFVRTDLSRPADLIVPIPLHRKKLAKRGFNQSFLLVREFPRLWVDDCRGQPAWAVHAGVLKRVVSTVSQTGLDIQERKKNVAGAFFVPNPAQVKGKQVLLVDDVLTTGATLYAAARALKAAGAAGVGGLILARA